MSQYTLSGNRFIIENYDRVPAFSSFLPGLAGVKGIPLWAFYTNRGQGINSFGVHHKGNAIMEFHPANTAYERTPVKGFRSFIRVNGDFYEPFCAYDPAACRRMEIERNVLSIREESRGLSMIVEYMILPSENIGALVRHVTVKNISEKELELELLDGMPQIIPYGIQNGQYKEMSNLFKSWADIKNIDAHVPLYTMRASSDDSAEVSEIQGGYFYCAVEDGRLLPVIYDKSAVFSYDDSLAVPVRFLEKGLGGVLEEEECFANKVPCAFIPFRKTLAAGESFSFAAYCGYAASVGFLNQKAADFCRPGYVEEKEKEARALADSFTSDVRTHTADPLFDQYMEQCYLDNFLRGGYPFLIGRGEKKAVVHLFSRKHGDPERDYNFFSTAGEYYSQGNGNYRDVCQNRRNDVFFNPGMGDFNVRCFYSLIQMDGYNPLEIRPCTFVIDGERRQQALEIIKKYVEDPGGHLAGLLEKPFTPGQITNLIAGHQLTVKGEETDLVEELLPLADQRIEAGFGEGYWSDHWDYNLDLVENYLSVYPERKEALLFGDESYRFYDSAGVVRPRSDTYVISKGKVRQYGSMYHCGEKDARPGFRADGTNWLKDSSGREVTTNLFGKMLTLAVNKFALLDPFGMGIEMEGGKPGWNDAMNGLPGLFGSSMPETLELKRLVDFMAGALCPQEKHSEEKSSPEGKENPEEKSNPEEENRQSAGELTGEMELPAELADFMREIRKALGEGLSDFDYWDRTACLREGFRERIRLCVTGETRTVTFGELSEVLEAFRVRLDGAVERAMEAGKGIMPTYYTYEAVSYEEVKNPDGTPLISPYGLPGAHVKAFAQVQLPCFLEGPARMLAACGRQDQDTARAMYTKIKETDIYDRSLKMYKTSESLEGMSMENGRVRAFTPGWLERESVFLHMEYKYFLGLLKAGLYDEFYEAIGNALIPYQDPEVYGRSILENSSFIASSANPDASVRGRGFVSRLSGSTVEMLSMWLGMFMGDGGFRLCEGALQFTLSPCLKGDFFDDQGEASFTLCGSCRVIYHNESRKNTYGPEGVRVRSMTLLGDKEQYEVTGDTVNAKLAEQIRSGGIRQMDAYLS